MKLRRRKVEDGAYVILDESGTVVAKVEEWGVAGYRWRVSPTDPAIRGWDTTSIGDAVNALTAVLTRAAR